MSRPPIFLVTYFIFAGWVPWLVTEPESDPRNVSLSLCTTISASGLCQGGPVQSAGYEYEKIRDISFATTGPSLIGGF